MDREHPPKENALLEVRGRGQAESCFAYTVQSGDCLSILAQRYGVSVALLSRINGLSPAERIVPGRKLLIPRG